MSIEAVGTYNGIPVYADPHSEEDKILVLRKQDSKPMRETRYPYPRIKGLCHSENNIKAFIVHPGMASDLIAGLNKYKSIFKDD